MLRMQMLLADKLLLCDQLLLESMLVRLESLRVRLEPLRVLLVKARRAARAALHINFQFLISNCCQEKFARIELAGVFMSRGGKIISEGGVKVGKPKKRKKCNGRHEI